MAGTLIMLSRKSLSDETFATRLQGKDWLDFESAYAIFPVKTYQTYRLTAYMLYRFNFLILC